ncbi:MAG: hypothetical protein HND45_10750 [Chloroflexi bacterium]|nr:hypothetical protein [Chloroflexota bacterium]
MPQNPHRPLHALLGGGCALLRYFFLANWTSRISWSNNTVTMRTYFHPATGNSFFGCISKSIMKVLLNNTPKEACNNKNNNKGKTTSNHVHKKHPFKNIFLQKDIL